MNLAEPFTLNMRPSFAKLMDCSCDERLAVYRDPAWRAATWEDVGKGGGALPFNWASVSVAESASRPDLAGRPVVELAEELGVTPLDVVLDLSLADDLKTRFWSVVANDDPEAIAWLLPRDNVLLGLADSGAHVSQLCDACFATDLLGHLGARPPGHAARAGGAQAHGRAGRGLRPGTTGGPWRWARRPTCACSTRPRWRPGPLRRLHDFPADGERLTADAPVGMTHALVNGVPIRLDGQAVEAGLDARPGVLLARA